MKFAVFTVGTPDYNLEQTVAKLKEFGYDGVEWRVAAAVKEKPQPLPPKESWYWTYNQSTVDLDTIEEQADYLQNLSKKYGVETAALATYLLPSQVEAVESVLKTATRIGCPRIRVNVPKYDGTEDYNQLFFRTQEQIAVLERLAKKYDVHINFEIHMGNIIPSASAAFRLVSPFDPNYIGIIHDAGNMVHEGFEQYQLGLELLGPYLDHVHLKNARWVIVETKASGQTVWRPQWCPIKSGQADLGQLLQVLKDRGYDKYLSFEDFSNEQSTEEKLRDNLSYIKSLI